ncbi:hypothetical protein [Pseudomonas sp. PDM05]|uniref:hypothetical protein n=1 Tax=Pseudomonas sp. PDM05 TaxID=2769301 RepID=UPI001CE0BBF8|nr:hypothetical protein [Pseudomonas sp. PDM05]
MLTFNTLWKNHPEIFGDAAPCRTNGTKNFSDQCAINLGVALRRSEPLSRRALLLAAPQERRPCIGSGGNGQSIKPCQHPWFEGCY